MKMDGSSISIYEVKYSENGESKKGWFMPKGAYNFIFNKPPGTRKGITTVSIKSEDISKPTYSTKIPKLVQCLPISFYREYLEKNDTLRREKGQRIRQLFDLFASSEDPATPKRNHQRKDIISLIILKGEPQKENKKSQDTKKKEEPEKKEAAKKKRDTNENPSSVDAILRDLISQMVEERIAEFESNIKKYIDDQDSKASKKIETSIDLLIKERSRKK
jgi:hypothetical protein